MDFPGTERFELIQRLGEGGFGIVYEAFDRRRQTRVALKVLRDAQGDPLYRFKREFRALVDVSHPNLVALDELLTDGQFWFFTMELVRGVPMTAYVRPADGPAPDARTGRPRGRLNERHLRAVLSQLADALTSIHRRGIVHCDLKPSNVLVTDKGRVVVLDFGLVSERPLASVGDPPAQSSASVLVVLGTPAYMAPEQAGTRLVTPAVDWYSVGVMLYEALTGQLPFAGSNLDVLQAKQWDVPRPPTDLAQDIPKDLAALTIDLLDADPARRPSGEAILQTFQHTHGRSTVDVATPAADVFLGRDAQLSALADAFDTRQNTSVAFVSGPSGIGKTALITHFLHRQRAKEPRLLALTGRCYERESMPYKSIDPLIDALTDHLKQLRDIEVARLLPRDVAILARLFPVLLEVDEVRRAPVRATAALDSFAVRQRAAEALRELLDKLALGAPVVLAIDDAQWGDADSGSILEQVLRPPDAPPLLLIAAYRSEDASEARLLRILRNAVAEPSGRIVHDIEIGSLSVEDARRLATRLTAGALDVGGRAEAIARESGGSPFFVHELAHHAITAGGATSLDAVVVDRVLALPPPARRLLVAVALSAQSIPSDVARAAAEVSRDEREALQLLRASRLVRTHGPPDQPIVETYHDRIREAVVAQVQPSEAAGWHRRLATAWEEAAIARPETLVVHFQGAGDRRKTYEYARAAAQNAEGALAFDRAAEFYDLLVRLEEDPAARSTWLCKLGEALANTGRGFEAATAFLKALDHSPTDRAIELERRAASELIRAGYLDEAAEVLDRLLPKVGVKAPRSDAAAVATLLLYRALLAIRGTGVRERSDGEIAPEVLRRIDVLTSISEPLCLTSLVRGQALIVQGAWHALRAGEPRRAVRGLTGLVASSAVAGTRGSRRTARLLAAAQSQAVQMRDPWTTGRTKLAEGFALKLSGHWQRGLEQLESAIEIFADCHGVRWEMESAQTLIHDSLLWMGEWNRLARELPARRQAAEQRGDLFAAAYVSARMSPVLHMAGDRIDSARAEVAGSLTRWTKRLFNLQHRFAVCSWIDIDLYTGDAASAAARLEKAWPALRLMLLGYQFGRIEMVFYRARIALALAAERGEGMLSRAERDARRLMNEGAAWAGALAGLIHAALAHARGDSPGAVAGLEAAETALLACQMNHYAAAAKFRRGHLIGGEAGRILIEEAAEWMRGQQMVNPMRMADLLTPGPW